MNFSFFLEFIFILLSIGPLRSRLCCSLAFHFINNNNNNKNEKMTLLIEKKRFSSFGVRQ